MNKYVGQALQLLSDGLNPFFREQLKDELGGLEWTEVLRELDRLKGKDGWTYSTRDVALQLRMLTERLGALEYPFDIGDPNRTLSTYGSVLRIVRKRWAHNDEFDPFEELAAVDTIRIVLHHILASELATKVAGLRSELMAEVFIDSVPAVLPRASSESDHLNSGLAGLIGGARIQLSGSTSGSGVMNMYGEVPWEEWSGAIVGQKTDLDNFRSKRTQEKVRSLIEEIVDSEGPIQVEVLVRRVGMGFGFSRLAKDRAKSISHQISRAEVLTDPDGFVWTQGIDLDKWLVFRRSTGEQRRFEEIAPIEIANAAWQLSLQNDLPLSSPELSQFVLEYFGRKKRTEGLNKHLAIGIAQAQVRNPRPVLVTGE